MALKIFNKNHSIELSQENVDESLDQTLALKIQTTVHDLGGEVSRLRQEVDVLLSRQESFRMALGRLREYLSERGANDEQAQEVGAQFQDISHENDVDGNSKVGSINKSKNHLH